MYISNRVWYYIYAIFVLNFSFVELSDGFSQALLTRIVITFIDNDKAETFFPLPFSTVKRHRSSFRGTSGPHTLFAQQMAADLINVTYIVSSVTLGPSSVKKRLAGDGRGTDTTVRGMTWAIDLRNIIITLTTSTLTNKLVNHAAHKIRFLSHVSY